MCLGVFQVCLDVFEVCLDVFQVCLGVFQEWVVGYLFSPSADVGGRVGGFQ